ncbi:conserved Plasmodium protein, unknown function [Plasmodium relictum]|uniref:Uncharacterized protein n=1 Tax=Plasmodium relictum TaxID=85471 RepID=A0A1J1H7N5_PLARL|nr:conserved Plasmodium protein, unknown function [Plasmodium relictum]CRG99605.1 conserved Plasmodium protein, unknown function [Plasmodium relictum]
MFFVIKYKYLHYNIFCSYFLIYRFKEGLCLLVNTLFRKLIFNVYYSFDKIKENNNIKKYRNEKKGIFNIRNLEKSKKNIEKFIDLYLTIFNILKGNTDFFIQFALENYATINLSSKKKKKKNIIKFDEVFLIYKLYNNSLLQRKKNENNNIKESHESIDLEKNILIGDKEIDSYKNKIPIIDNHIDKHNIYARSDLINELDNFLNVVYLKKSFAHEHDKDIKKKNENLIDEDFVTKNLFSEYFSSCRKNSNLNILIKEVSSHNLLNFLEILNKNIKFIRSFNMKINEQKAIDNYKLSKFFEF